MYHRPIRLIKIGNSLTIRIPKRALVDSGLHNTNGTLDLKVNPGKLVFTSSRQPRLGWVKQTMDDIAANGQVPTVWQ